MRRSLSGPILAALMVAAGGLGWHVLREPAQAARRPAHAIAAIPVEAGTATTRDVPVYLTGLGTVQAFNTVVVKARVDGQLDRVAFTEGQDVKAGDILAQIDPLPFQAALDQAKATIAKDQSQLENARLDLKRFTDLGDFATKQSVDTQNALVRQLEATIEGDQAAIESAQVQLDYTTIRAPIAGRTGIRLVDQGNIVHASDPNGLVVITQLQPISVIFTLPDDQLSAVMREMAAGPLAATAFARGDQKALGEGTLSLVDNQIDQGTGTIRLKATFANADRALWPGQFVNVRLLLQTLHQVVTVPSTAVQRGPDGMYVYVINPDSTVAIQPVGIDRMGDGIAVVKQGLTAGTRIVVTGQYRLQPGATVAPQAAVDPSKAG